APRWGAAKQDLAWAGARTADISSLGRGGAEQSEAKTQDPLLAAGGHRLLPGQDPDAAPLVHELGRVVRGLVGIEEQDGRVAAARDGLAAQLGQGLELHGGRLLIVRGRRQEEELRVG